MIALICFGSLSHFLAIKEERRFPLRLAPPCEQSGKRQGIKAVSSANGKWFTKQAKERKKTMKRTKKSSLLTAAAAVAGVAMGAGIALAAHPPIQLFTYEEVAAQMNGTVDPLNPFSAPVAQMPVMVDPASKQGMPYSPKQTCMGGGNMACHTPGNTVGLKSYSDVSEHAFHAALGYNEWMDNSDSGLFMENGKQTGLNPQKPWLQSHGHNGKW